MKIIAESGSTKTDWALLNEDKVLLKISTSGFNPTYFPASVLEKSIQELLPRITASEINDIFFYGSGCAANSSKKVVKKELSKHFMNAKIEVQHDLFGAARALFGDDKGIAAILGTGSSSCFFENKQITRTVPSLGYLLADEGSGAYIGAEIIKALFYEELPDKLKKAIISSYHIETSDFIPDLYALEKPNAYLASFVPFAVEHKSEPVIRKIVKNSFKAFFKENILRYKDIKDHKIGFTGSVAYLFRAYLEAVADEHGLQIEKIIQRPMDDLIKYHLETEG